MICKSTCGLLLLLASVLQIVSGGYPGVVDDEIWHHVLKVLSKTHGGSKIILGHPEPAHLVDAYTKVEYHEPHHHYGGGYHHHDHHQYGHYGGGGYHHSHGHVGHHPHHHAPVYKYKAPVIASSYGPPYHHHHHHGHYRK